MKPVRILLLAALLIPALPAQATTDEEAWPAFGHALSLIHLFVRMAAEGEQPGKSFRALDDVLSGRNVAANEAVAGLMKEMLADVPPQHRATIAAIGRDLVTAARKNLLVGGGSLSRSQHDAMYARKQLTEMGLTYHDSRQFLDAVKRNDSIAAELFVAGGGVDLRATDFWGRDAVDFARANGNERLAELVTRSRPAAR